MRETTGLYAPVLRTSFETRSADKKRDEEAYLVSEDAAKELQTICLEKIRAAARSGALVGHSQLASILYRWRDWASAEEPRVWVQTILQSDEDVLAFLVAFLQQSTSQTFGDHAVRSHWRIRLGGLEPFVEIDRLEQRIDRLKIRELSEKQKEAINQFRKAIKRRKQGKPDSDFLRDDDDD
jgi:predicted KAP-like P-loop ATPase